MADSSNHYRVWYSGNVLTEVKSSQGFDEVSLDSQYDVLLFENK